MTLGRATVTSLISQVATLATTFLSGVIIARALGASGKGTYSLVVLTHAFAVLIGNLGVPVFVASSIGKRRHSVDALLRNSVLLFTCSTVLLMCVFLSLRGWLSQRTPFAPFLGLVAVVAPLGLLREHLAAFLQGLNRIGRFSLTRVIGQIVTLALLLVFLLNHPGIWTAFYCWAIGEAASLAVTLAFVWPLTSPGISVSTSLLRESLRFGGAVWLGSLMGMANFRLDAYLVAYFLGTSAVGLYSVAVTVSYLVLYIPYAMGIALLPRFSSASRDEAYELASKACRMTLLCGIGCAVVLVAIGGAFIRAVYGSAFSASAEAMLILLPGTVAYGLAYVTSAYFTAFAGRPGINAALVAISLVIGIALDFVLIPAFGISGASLASSVAYVLSVLVILVVFGRISGRKPLALVTVRKSDFLDIAGFVSRSLRTLTRTQ